MIVIGINTTGSDAGIAIAREGCIVSERIITKNERCSKQSLLAAFKNILKKCGFKNASELNIAVFVAGEKGIVVTKEILKKLNFYGEMIAVTRHDAIAAEAYYSSGFDEAAILVLDSRGSFAKDIPGVRPVLAFHPLSRELNSYYAGRNGHLIRIRKTYSDEGAATGPAGLCSIAAFAADYGENDVGKIARHARQGKPPAAYSHKILKNCEGDFAAVGDPALNPADDANFRFYFEKYRGAIHEAERGAKQDEIRRDFAAVAFMESCAASVKMAEYLINATGLSQLCVAGSHAALLTREDRICGAAKIKIIQFDAENNICANGAALYGLYSVCGEPYRPKEEIREDGEMTLSCSRKKALVVNPPFLFSSDYIDYPYFASLGALHCAGALEQAGYDVCVADSFSEARSGVEESEENLFQAGCGIGELLKKYCGNSFDFVVVCLSVYHRPYERNDILVELFERICELMPDAIVVAADAYIGGMHYVDYDTCCLFSAYPQVDALVRYESEQALLRCLDEAEKGGRNVFVPTKKELDVNPDELPQPAWHLVDVESYMRFVNEFFEKTKRADDIEGEMPLLPVVLSRGCLYSCSFCFAADKSKTGRYRRCSHEYIEKYIKSLKRNYNIRAVAIIDGLANGSSDSFNRLVEFLEDENLRVVFPNGLRADRLANNDIEALPHVSQSISISAESACERVRNGILAKNLKIENIERIAKQCARAELPLKIHYMIGVPDETPEEINITLSHAAGMAEKYGAAPSVQQCVPIPGAPIYNSGDDDFDEWENEFDNLKSFNQIYKDDSGVFDTNKAIKMFRRRISYAAPEKIIVNLTYRCENRCAMCAVGGKPLLDMPYEAAAGILKDYRARGASMVDFDGGEPTLHPELLPVINAAEMLGFEKISITTNGRRFADRGFASRLLLSGISGLLVSVYGGDDATHDKVTGVKGSFRETSEGLRMAARLRPENISLGVNTVLLNSNYKSLNRIVEIALDSGADVINVQFMTPFGRASEDLRPPMEKAIDAINETIRLYSNSIRIRVINAAPCELASCEMDIAEDSEKYARHMAFVDCPPENLGTYLSRKKERIPQCGECEYFVVCEGVYKY